MPEIAMLEALSFLALELRRNKLKARLRSDRVRMKSTITSGEERRRPRDWKI
jgi:hypothetical protein